MKQFLGLMILLLLAPPFLRGEDWLATDGHVYKNVKVISHTADTVTIIFDGGGLNLPLKELPPNVQARFATAPRIAPTPVLKPLAAEKNSDSPLNFNDLQSLLSQIGELKYNRFQDYEDFQLNKVAFNSPDENVTFSLDSFSDGDHPCQQDKVTIYVIRSAPEWRWLKYHDNVVLAAGKERFSPSKIDFDSDVADDGVIEILDFQMPVEVLGRLANLDDFAIQIGVAEYQLSGRFSEAVISFCSLNQFLPKEGDKVDLDQPHSARYEALLAKEKKYLAEQQPSAAQVATEDNSAAIVDSPPPQVTPAKPVSKPFNPGSINDGVLGR